MFEIKKSINKNYVNLICTKVYNTIKRYLDLFLHFTHDLAAIFLKKKKIKTLKIYPALKSCFMKTNCILQTSTIFPRITFPGHSSDNSRTTYAVQLCIN